MGMEDVKEANYRLKTVALTPLTLLTSILTRDTSLLINSLLFSTVLLLATAHFLPSSRN